MRECFARSFLDFGWSVPFADLERDLDSLLRALDGPAGGAWTHLERNYQVRVLGSAFYRNKAAYVLGKIVNGNAATPMTDRMVAGPGVMQPDGTMKHEPRMDAKAVGDAVAYMATLPLDANVLTMTVMASKMPFVGRG